MRTRLSSRGQLVVPKEIRQRRGWNTGTEIEVSESGDAVVLRAVRGTGELDVADLLGCVAYEGPRRTLEEMEAAVRREARRR